MLKNISVATSENVGYYKLLKQSCAKHNIEFIPLGLNQPWKGLHMKFELWIDYLNKLPDDEIRSQNLSQPIILEREVSL